MTLLPRRSKFFLVVAAVLAITALAASSGLWTGLLWAQSESGTTVSLTPSTTTVKEGETAQFTVTMSPAPQEPQVLTYTIGTDGDDTTVDADADDYTGRSIGVVTIPAGSGGAESSTAVISIEVTDDSDIDAGAREVMVVRLDPSDAARSADSGGFLASAVVTIHEGICDRTQAVRDAIVAKLGASDCWSVTDSDLRDTPGDLDLTGGDVSQFKARDLIGLSGLDGLRLRENGPRDMPDETIAWLADQMAGLTKVSWDFAHQQSWPEGALDQASSLTHFTLHMDSLTSLPETAFGPVPNLTHLTLHMDSLTSLPDGIFGPVPNLTHLTLHMDSLMSLPDGIFDGLNNLVELTVTGEYIAPDGVLPLEVELERSGPYSIVAKVREGTPFDITVNLIVESDSISRQTVVISAGSVSSTPVEITDIVDEARITAESAAFSGDLSQENDRRFSVNVGDPPAFIIVALPTVSLVSGTDSVLEGEGARYTVLVEDFWQGMNFQVGYSVGPDDDSSTNNAEFVHSTGPLGLSDFTEDDRYFAPTIEAEADRPDGADIEHIFTVGTVDDDYIDDGAQEYFVVTLEAGSGYRLGTVSTWRTVIKEGVCDRTQQVQDAVLQAQELSEQELGLCSEVTDKDLAKLITGFALNDSGIVTLKARDFIGMTDLQSLRLDGNSLTDLPDGLFSDQALLSVLNLRHNELRDVRSGMWTGPDALRGLLLSNNKLGAGALSADDFEGLGTLKTLWLDGNNIRTLPNDVFEHLDGLSHLNLGYNLLSDVPSGTFSEVTNLRRLDLDGNSISSVGKERSEAFLPWLTWTCNSMTYTGSPRACSVGCPSCAVWTSMGIGFTASMSLPNWKRLMGEFGSRLRRQRLSI